MSPFNPKKKPSALAIGIGPAPAKKSMPPSFGGSVKKEAASEGEPLAEETREKAAPMGDTDDQQGGEVEISPEAVGYRSLDETCDSCKYNENGMCKPLKIEIGSGCNLFISMGGGEEEMGEEPMQGGSPMPPQKPQMGGM